MVTEDRKNRLKSSWGDKAESMNCYVEVRVFDPRSSWECYIYAMNPEDEDEICCIIKGFFVEVSAWKMSELANRFNSEGDNLQIDYSYNPRKAVEELKRLKEEEKYEWPRY